MTDPDLWDEVHAWLDKHWDPDLSVEEWWRVVAGAGWTVPHFSVEHGGRGLPRRAEATVRAAFASYGALKREVTDAVEALLAPIRQRYAELSADPGHVREILAEGKARVRPAAADTVRRTRAAIGLMD